jgi:hypothetical protein
MVVYHWDAQHHRYRELWFDQIGDVLWKAEPGDGARVVVAPPRHAAVRFLVNRGPAGLFPGNYLVVAEWQGRAALAAQLDERDAAEAFAQQMCDAFPTMTPETWWTTFVEQPADVSEER